MSMLSHIWRASQFIPDTLTVIEGKKKPKSIWHPFYKSYWKYVQSGNFNGVFNYNTAAKKRKEGGLGAIQPLLEIQALKAHWMVRMLINKRNGESWAQLMWMEFKRVSEKYRVKKPKAIGSWKSVNIHVKSLMEDIIKCWVQCGINVVKEDHKERKWISEDGTHKPLKQLTVKVLYTQLLKKNTATKKKKLTDITEAEWKERWLYLDGAKHLGPRDKQIRFRIQQGKLWCGPNRSSKNRLYPVCPICKCVEVRKDHAVSTECGLTQVMFIMLAQKWLEWSSNNLDIDEWNNDWIAKSTPFRNQKDMVITTAKRTLYFNYLQVVHQKIPSIETNGLIAIIMSALKYKIKAAAWMGNTKGSQNMDGWDLQGNWALFDIESNKWMAIDDSFALQTS